AGEGAGGEVSLTTMNPKRKAVTYSVGFLLLLLLLAFVLARPPEEAATNGDLALTFLGMTNNPARSFRPVRLEVVSGTNTLCAVFRVTCLTADCSIQFDQEGVETRSRGQWVWDPIREQAISGSRWTPGYSCLYAVPWPPRVPTNENWRAVI